MRTLCVYRFKTLLFIWIVSIALTILQNAKMVTEKRNKNPSAKCEPEVHWKNLNWVFDKSEAGVKIGVIGIKCETFPRSISRSRDLCRDICAKNENSIHFIHVSRKWNDKKARDFFPYKWKGKKVTKKCGTVDVKFTRQCTKHVNRCIFHSIFSMHPPDFYFLNVVKACE